MEKLKEKVIKDYKDFKIPFKERTQKYGRAEFIFCIKWKNKFRGWKRVKILDEVFIYPAQQPDAKFYYRIKNGFSDSITIQSWVGLDDPKIWFWSWCKEHKCMSVRIYVPNDSKHIDVCFLSTMGFYFGKDTNEKN
jgi:hypothetical protein